MSMGWQCPSCSRCYSPNVSQCFHCGPTQFVTAPGTVPWVPNPGITVTPIPSCEHDLDYTQTVPRCRRCGTMFTFTAVFSSLVHDDSPLC